MGETCCAVRPMEDDRRRGSVARGGDGQGAGENGLGGGTRIRDEHRSVAESVMMEFTSEVRSRRVLPGRRRKPIDVGLTIIPLTKLLDVVGMEKKLCVH